MALLVLTALDVLFALVNELEDVGRGRFGYFDAFYYVFLTLPTRFYELFAASVLVGALLSLGALASNSELVAMRAAGVSVGRIVRSAVQAGFFLMLFVTLIGEFLVPVLERHAQSVDSKKEGINVSRIMSSGLWIRDGEYYINIGQVYPDLRLQNTTIQHVNDENQLISSTSAESAYHNQDQWELHGVKRSTFSPDGIEVESKKIEL